jgi:ankyrin repeat protein
MRSTVVTLILAAALVPAASFAQTSAAKPSTRAAAGASRAITKVDADGTTALHWAVRNNDIAQIDRLLRAGANPNAANRYGVTPIYLACQNGSAAAVARLLKAGVSANATGNYGETALMTCARTGNVDAAKVLVEAGASLNAVESWHGETALMWAAAEGHPEMIEALIKAGADANARSTVVTWERQRTQEPRDKWLPPGGFTALHFAAREGCVACVNVLLSNGVDINAIDPQGNSALVLALINGHYDAAAVLIDRGIDLTLADETGQTALYAAVDMHTMPASNRPAPKEIDNQLTSFDIIKKLVERGAPLNVQQLKMRAYRTKLDRGGETVLGPGTTPLLRAAKAADMPVIKLLLDKGADAKLATSAGVNAIMMAAGVGTREEDTTGRSKTQKDIIEAIALLARSGVNLNAQDGQGRTAAHGAAMWGYTDVIKFLAQSGADLTIKDKRGLTALDAAMGLAGGLGFDGKSGTVHEDTAKAIREILGDKAEFDPNKKPVGSPRADDPGNRTQSQDLPN